jgi:hypothetical protein
MTACRERGLKLGSDVRSHRGSTTGPFTRHLPTPISVLSADFLRDGARGRALRDVGGNAREPRGDSLIVRESV